MAIRFLKIAAVYLCLGVLLGLTMGILEDFTMTSVHAHINLLGWVSMALFGLIYHFYPAASETKMAKTHFWLHNIGVPVMQGSIALLLTGTKAVVPVVIVSSIVVIIGVFLFTINLLINAGAKASVSAQNKSI
jgi:cbb3-type cytochrome oxidase subunit 1